MGFKCLQQPAVEPIDADAVKLYLRIDDADQDSLISDLIVAARETVETFLNKKLITQEWRMYLDAFPGYIDQRLGGNIIVSPIAIGATSYMAGIRWAIVPPWGPVQSVDALTYLDANGGQTTMAVNVDYLQDIVSVPARLTPPFGKFWPISRIQTNSVSVDWTSGYGDAGTDVPSSIKTAMKLLIAQIYENREPMPDGKDENALPLVVRRLLTQHRDLRL